MKMKMENLIVIELYMIFYYTELVNISSNGVREI
jgi:hypothetical protein